MRNPRRAARRLLVSHLTIYLHCRPEQLEMVVLVTNIHRTEGGLLNTHLLQTEYLESSKFSPFSDSKVSSIKRTYLRPILGFIQPHMKECFCLAQNILSLDCRRRKTELTIITNRIYIDDRLSGYTVSS